jgi:hypothetical protein
VKLNKIGNFEINLKKYKKQKYNNSKITPNKQTNKKQQKKQQQQKKPKKQIKQTKTNMYHLVIQLPNYNRKF